MLIKHSALPLALLESQPLASCFTSGIALTAMLYHVHNYVYLKTFDGGVFETFKNSIIFQKFNFRKVAMYVQQKSTALLGVIF